MSDTEINNTNTTPLNDLLDRVEGVLTQDNYTPYQAAGAVSKIVDQRVREQMMYNYCKKGYIPSHVGTKTTNKGEREVTLITKEDLTEWVLKYAAKKMGKLTEVTAVEVVEEETETTEA